MEQLLYSRKSAAQSLGISLRAVCHLIRNRHLETVCIGGRSLIPRTELVRLATNGLSTPITGTGGESK